MKRMSRKSTLRILRASLKDERSSNITIHSYYLSTALLASYGQGGKGNIKGFYE